jgi:hypothetical protein
MIELCNAIEAHITDAVKDLRMAYPRGEPRPPQVVHGFLPPKQRGNDADDDAPFIIVRPVDGSDGEQDSTVTVALIFSAYAEDERGVDEVLHALWRVRNSLLAKRMLENRFEMRLPLDWRVYEDQPAPYWFAAMVTRWVINQPQRQLEGFVYGSEI